ncbi:MAG: hypothetical protein AB7E04_08495 [Desulfobacteraceae bacterium]|jgi:hypothetical protein
MRNAETLSQTSGNSVFIPREVWEDFEKKKTELNKKYPPEIAGLRIRKLAEKTIMRGGLNG